MSDRRLVIAEKHPTHRGSVIEYPGMIDRRSSGEQKIVWEGIPDNKKFSWFVYTLNTESAILVKELYYA